MKLLDRLQSTGPKRILSLDGGGIRGALTVGYLKRLETLLRKKHNNPELKLCDYFDLIGGTSTGSIIASALAIGMTADEIKDAYFDLGGRIFKKKRKIWNPFQFRKFLHAAFNEAPLEKELRNVFGDIRLNSEEIKTGLCIVTKRADTQSLWLLLNHPNGKFFSPENGNNGAIFLRDAIRASAAAPTYFIPTRLKIGNGLDGAFVDGGVSMANNPSLQLLMVATLQGFPFHWNIGSDQLLMTSIGTGSSLQRSNPDEVTKRWLKDWAMSVPNMLMQDASVQNEMLLQWIAYSPTAREIDMEIGDLSKDELRQGHVLHYLRYNTWMETDHLKTLGFNFDQEKVKSLQEMSNGENRFLLYEIGEKAAEAQIKADHFPEVFNLKKELV